METAGVVTSVHHIHFCIDVSAYPLADWSGTVTYMYNRENLSSNQTMFWIKEQVVEPFDNCL